MMLICNIKTILVIYLSIISIIMIKNANLKPRPRARNDKDPFNALGIPDLNPKTLLMEIDQENNKNKPKNEAPQLKTIDDLPNFLQKSNLSEDEGIKVLTRFLIQDDLTLKKYGVVYDQNGFDGLPKAEPLAPIGTDERLVQRARSAANIWFKNKYPKLDYDAYGAENIMDEIVPNWRIFKVLMIGKNGESTFVKICLPLDESETALGSDKDDACGPRTQFVEKEKAKNEAYIQQIRSKKFFRKKSSGVVKLLPGEKMVVKESNKTVILDSHNIEEKILGNNNFYNPPTLDQKINDPLLTAFQRKNNNLPMNLRNFGRSPFQSISNPLTNTNMPSPSNNPLNNFNYNFNNNNNNMNTNTNFPNIFPNYNNYGNNFGFNPMQQQAQPFKMPALDLLNNNNNMNFMQQSQNQQSQMAPKTMSPGMNGIKALGFKFKEKEPAPDNSNSFSRLENELAQMKKQLSDMMSSLKQKDMIIKEQNNKLSQFMNSGNPSVQQTPNPLQTNPSFPNTFPGSNPYQQNMAQQMGVSSLYPSNQFTQPTNQMNGNQMPFNGGRFLTNNNFNNYQQQGFNMPSFSS